MNNMDNNIEKELLEVIRKNLTGANVQAIESIIKDNKQLHFDNEELTKRVNLLTDTIKDISIELDDAKIKLAKADNILAREQVLITREQDARISDLFLERQILTIKLEASNKSKDDIYRLSEIFFKNRNIHHMVNTSVNVPVANNGYTSLMPTTNTENHIKTDDNGEIVND